MRKRDADFRFACPAGLFVDIDLGLKGPQKRFQARQHHLSGFVLRQAFP